MALDDVAFNILRSRQWRPRDLHSAAQKELRREQRVENLRRKYIEQLRDPMTMDLVGWDESNAKGTNWPFCHKCKNIVRGFAIEDRETDRPTVVAWCHGQKQGITVHRPRTGDDARDGKRLRDLYKHLVFFAG